MFQVPFLVHPRLDVWNVIYLFSHLTEAATKVSKFVKNNLGLICSNFCFCVNISSYCVSLTCLKLVV